LDTYIYKGWDGKRRKHGTLRKKGRFKAVRLGGVIEKKATTKENPERVRG